MFGAESSKVSHSLLSVWLWVSVFPPLLQEEASLPMAVKCVCVHLCCVITSACGGQHWLNPEQMEDGKQL